MKTYALLGVVALITSSASAVFTNWTVEMSSVGQGFAARDIYSIYANFSNTGINGSEGMNARIINVYDFGTADSTPTGNQISVGRIGTMNAVHNDSDSGVSSVGTWCAGTNCYNNTTQSLTDSFVTVKGVGANWGTNLDPGFMNPSGLSASDIAQNAGWYTDSIGTPYLVGSTLKYKVMQIARIAGDYSVFRSNMTLGYAALGSQTALFGYGSITIPGPGALSLLGLVGAFGRRRRS